MSPNLRIKLDKKLKISFGQKMRGFLLGGKRERRRERALTSLYDLRRSVGQNSSRQERKFIYSIRATRGYRKHEISPRIQARSSGNQRFRV